MKDRAKRQYRTNAELFKSVRKTSKMSLRQVAQETGVGHCTIQRLEKGCDINAKAYIAIMLWTVMNNPNIH